MKENLKVPADYIPFDELMVCGNKLIKVDRLIEIEGRVPLLVGKGSVPLIWLYLPPMNTILDWSPAVIANKSIKPNIHVNVAPNLRVNITAERHSIIDVIQNSPNSAEILQLDLRPFGLDIHGDTQSLYVGKARLSQNVFQNVNVMIGIGSKSKPPSNVQSK